MADVCLLLEGTYPYVAGGVSSWVHQLIREFSDTTFSLLYLGPRRSAAKKLHYEIPENVVDFREVYLFDYQVNRERTLAGKKEDFEILFDFFNKMRKGEPSLLAEISRIMGLPNTRTVSLYDLAYSWEGWKMLERLYEREEEETSFLDYFWTWRFLFLPFFSLLRLELPDARLYHSVSTGYAGILGAVAKMRHQRPFLLTEHGIYTRERKIEISKADWIYSENAEQLVVLEGHEFFREWWIQLFSFLSRATYEWADEIITLYEGNRKVQLEEGADPAKIQIIPNGVPYESFASLPKRTCSDVLKVGFVGRVVPIKDLKTYIKACRIIYDQIKQVEFYVIGPWDEDEDYYRECLFLVEMESLTEAIHFTGKVNVCDYYPLLNVLVLTSISEAQPIAILEAQACGVPVVATDVGACRELLFGRTPDDKLLGTAGMLTPICNPEATAQAVIRILQDPTLARQMGNVGKKRIQSYYQMDDLIANYRSIYQSYIEQVCW